MKFNCGLSREDRAARELDAFFAEEERLSQWHPHFCWLPVRIKSGDCRWLETVERKLLFRDGILGDLWKYRELPKNG